MTNVSRPLRNQSGQLVVEAVLLLTITISLSMMISKSLQEHKFAQKLVAQPWSTLSGMIECGVWSGCGKGKHPNAINRDLSLRPDN